jgi:predicted acylesterase/phospholipase RssA
MTPSYDALVLSGGGIKGIAMLGATNFLKDRGYLRGVTTYVGSSVGAIVATVLAMDKDPEEVFDNHVVPFKWKHDIDITLLDRGFGLDTGSAMDAWLKRIVPSDLTFEDVRRLHGKTLVIAVTNLNARQAEYFGPETHPHFPVARALRMSCSVPLYFSAVKYAGKLYVDGGVCDNFPVEHVAETGAKNILGIRFATKIKPENFKWTLDAFLGAVLESSLTRKTPRGATIVSLECGSTTQPLDFKVSDDVKRLLFTEGYDQTETYMKKIQ